MSGGMRLTVLASGSRGNACVVEAGGATLLLDAGLSCRELVSRLHDVGLRPESIEALIITHEHLDHLRGAGPFARRFGVPVYLNKGTYDRCEGTVGRLPERVCFDTGGTLVFGGLLVETFTKCHDAADPLGVVLRADGVKAGVLTDLGRSTRLVEDRLKGCDALIMEFNHDEQMLREGPYPLAVKRRILGREGHLSNEEAGALLEVLSHPDLKHVVTAHLSEVNNRPEMAFQQARGVLDRRGLTRTRVHLSSQFEPGPRIVL